MPKVIVDNKVIEVPNGTSAMDAVFHAGSDVPLFCAEKHLSPVGACRMCLVKAGSPRKNPDGSFILDEQGQPKIFWMPKLVASCTTAISDGMVIDTQCDDVKHAQSGMVELTLANHPLDCPTCDKGGACELQDRTMEYGLVSKFYQPDREELPMYTRFDMTRRHVDKHHALSDLVTLDRERCIHCKRCIRYFDEIPGDNVLDFIERGVHTFINTEDKGMPSNFTGNIVDICPVGALLDQTARFRGRNWEYGSTPTTSMDDAAGAAIVVDTRSGHLERIRGGDNSSVNQVWIGDATRFGHDWVGQNRVTTPMVRKDGQLVQATWEEAAAAIAAGLANIDNNQIAFHLAHDATLEEGFIAKALADGLGSSHLDFQHRTAFPVTAFKPATFEQLVDAPYVLVLGDPTEECPTVHLRLSEFSRGIKAAPKLNHGTPFADLNIKEKMPRLKHKMALFSSYPARMAKWAGVNATHQPGDEVALLAALLEQSAALPDGVSAAQLDSVKAGLAQDKAVLVLGAAVLNNPMAASKARALAERHNLRVVCMSPAANARGLEALDIASGNSKVAAKAAYVGYNADASALAGLSFVVAHVSHNCAVMEQAHVVLPALVPVEKRGHTQNLEGRALALEAADITTGLADGALAVFNMIAECKGLRLPAKLVRQATKALEVATGLRAGQMWSKTSSIAAPSPVNNHQAGVAYRPTMWKAHQLVGDLAGQVDHTLECSPQTAAQLGLVAGQHVSVDAKQYTVALQAGLPLGAVYVPALGNNVGRMTAMPAAGVLS